MMYTIYSILSTGWAKCRTGATKIVSLVTPKMFHRLNKNVQSVAQ
jgi:hypothetical protein